MKDGHQIQKVRLITSLVSFTIFAATLSVEAGVKLDTVYVPAYGEGTLNDAITAAINDGTISNKVFKLRSFERYVLTATITIPAGKRLTIVADEPVSTQASAPPQILWTAAAGVDKDYNFDCYGDIILKNVWLLYATTAGTQTWSSLRIRDSQDSINGQRATFEGVIFDYAGIGADGGGAVSITARHFRGKFTNCYFRNCTDPHWRYYGRAVSFPFMSSGWHNDSLTFVNCTFANIGYVIMQEGGEYSDYLFMNHCTFLNTVMFTLESGWWHWLSLTNSVFVNAFMYGDFPVFTIVTGEQPPGGTVCIDSVARFGFPVPFNDTQRHILFTNSSYSIQSWLREHMANADPIWYPDSTIPIDARKPHPQPMMNRRTLAFFDTVINGTKVFPYISRANLHDSTDPGYILPATNEAAIKRFLTMRWTTSEDTNWAFMPQASLSQTWPLPENLRVTNSVLRAAGIGGFPLGDLYHWDKPRYVAWKAQEASENDRILSWLRNGITGVVEKPDMPRQFALEQNYPNPFNPSTNIRFTIKNRAEGIPSGQFTILKVFDVLGREVATLVNEELKPGSYERVFDGSRFASGVYFYRLKSGSFTQTRTLVLTK
ncbi:MAG: T9SS type A sorting domain-containing protein [Ignavibacteriae bacterium]|nr:T9SS type A sorting domain-containing protein [Ignavibacteriota bacterium]